MPKATEEAVVDAAQAFDVHLLDVGNQKYGDCALLVFGSGNKRISVLIDGGHPGDYQSKDDDHPSIPDQIKEILGDKPTVDLLIVSHGHQDHIGCLPHLVDEGFLRAKYALVADPGLAWGRTSDEDVDSVDVDDPAYRLRAALREEPLDPNTSTERLDEFIEDAAKLEPTYRAMLARLEADGTQVVRRGRDDEDALVQAFQKIGMKVYGPSEELLLELADRISEVGRDAVDSAGIALDSPSSVIDAYRNFLAMAEDFDKKNSPGPAINCQSIVVSFTYGGKKVLFSGDSQLADPELFDSELNGRVKEFWKSIAADRPFDFVKIGHHASYNAFDETMFDDLEGTTLFGIMNGTRDKTHPNPLVLDLLRKHRQKIKWARTDRNGWSTLSFPQGEFDITRGRLNDSRENVVDEAVVAGEKAVAIVPAVAPAPAGAPVIVSSGNEFVELTAKIPTSVRNVTINISMDRPGGPAVDHPFRAKE